MPPLAISLTILLQFFQLLFATPEKGGADRSAIGTVRKELLRTSPFVKRAVPILIPFGDAHESLIVKFNEELLDVDHIQTKIIRHQVLIKVRRFRFSRIGAQEDMQAQPIK